MKSRGSDSAAYDRIDVLPEIWTRARERFPHRFAPDGTPLIRFAGSSWAERLESATPAGPPMGEKWGTNAPSQVKTP